MSLPLFPPLLGPASGHINCLPVIQEHLPNQSLGKKTIRTRLWSPVKRNVTCLTPALWGTSVQINLVYFHYKILFLALSSLYRWRSEGSLLAKLQMKPNQIPGHPHWNFPYSYLIGGEVVLNENEAAGHNRPAYYPSLPFP